MMCTHFETCSSQYQYLKGLVEFVFYNFLAWCNFGHTWLDGLLFDLVTTWSHPLLFIYNLYCFLYVNVCQPVLEIVKALFIYDILFFLVNSLGFCMPNLWWRW